MVKRNVVIRKLNKTFVKVSNFDKGAYNKSNFPTNICNKFPKFVLTIKNIQIAICFD